MTLVLAITSKRSIWLLTDRRLSRGSQSLKDDAIKTMILETTDGVAILGYAGLGATARGTEPSDWMSRVLRSVNLPLEQSLGILASAMQKQLIRHLRFMSPGYPVAHHVIIPAFIGQNARLYSIDLVLAPDRKKSFFRYTRHEWTYPSGAVLPPTIAYGGSGGLVLQNKIGWSKQLRRLVKAHDRGLVSPHVVTDCLAAINYQVHLADPSVGPNSNVTWRYRKERFAKFNASSQSYSDTSRENHGLAVPLIVTGLDMGTIGRITLAELSKRIAEKGPSAISDAASLFSAALLQLPAGPDDHLE